MKTSIFLLTIFFLFASVHTIIISVENACSYTIWPAAYVVGGGRRLESGDTWTFDIQAGDFNGGRIWGRTGCNFDASGFGTCQTGDCDGALECGTLGKPPHTFAQFNPNPFVGLDYFYVGFVDGFNLPMEISAVSGCSSSSRCSFNITRVCPDELLVPGGCLNPCNSSGECKHPKVFKEICPDACSYLNEEITCAVTCPRGTEYRVVFCPGASYSLVCY